MARSSQPSARRVSRSPRPTDAGSRVSLAAYIAAAATTLSRATPSALHVEQGRVVGQLRQPAAEDEQAGQDKDRASDDRDGAGVAAEAAHERAGAVDQQPHEEERHPQAQR